MTGMSSSMEAAFMIVEPKAFGRLFINSPVSQYEDLEFVARGL